MERVEERGDDPIGRTLYGEIRELAGQRLHGDAAARSISATDFAHEIVLRGLRHRALEGVPRLELLRRIGRLAREVLVDRARARAALKRGGAERVDELLFEPAAATGVAQVDLLDLDEVLTNLEQVSKREAEILELRYFAGCEVAEVAELLGVSKSTVEKDERRARAWLAARLRPVG